MRVFRPLSVLFAFVALVACPVASGAGQQQPFVSGSWAQIRTAQTGLPTVVHFWGLTCAPCRVKMPEWGRFKAEFPKANLVLIHAERAPPKVEAIAEFLQKSGLAGAQQWYFAERFLERLRFEIDPGWHGETPMTLLISKSGEVRSIIGSPDLDDIRRWIDEDARK